MHEESYQVNAECQTITETTSLPSEISIKCKSESYMEEDQQDEIIEETIEKYEALIESLYEQVDEVQK